MLPSEKKKFCLWLLKTCSCVIRNQDTTADDNATAPRQYLSNGYNAGLGSRPLLQKENLWDHEPVRAAAAMNPATRLPVNENDITQQSEVRSAAKT